ncbi:hypothetical protein ACI79D_13375 [Geodermatophilus sp. SYSU D00708]
MTWVSSAIALPYPDGRSALVGLRAEIDHEVARGDVGTPDWSTAVLVGPVPLHEGEGQRWFDYVLSVACRRGAAATGDGPG